MIEVRGLKKTFDGFAALDGAARSTALWGRTARAKQRCCAT